MQKHIRVLALALLRREDGRILLEKGEDTVKGETFYRPLGGGVEFGERGEMALIREFQEELGKVITVDKLLGTIENIFEWQGKSGHEVILLYACRFSNSGDARAEHLAKIDGPGKTYWKSVAEIKSENARFYPLGIEVWV